jgi:hypothetical protein
MAAQLAASQEGFSSVSKYLGFFLEVLWRAMKNLRIVDALVKT